MKRILIVITLIVLTGTLPTKAQLIEIKPWHGSYPEMGDSYPLSFVAFKGWLIPKPHVFVLTWPTHYYIETDAMPVTDEAGISGDLQTGLMRILAKALERSLMKGRMEETEQIKGNTSLSRQINARIFNARSDELSDIHQLAEGFIDLYQKVKRLGRLENSAQVHSIYEKEADQLLLQFLSVNLFQTGHGSKLEAFTEIRYELGKLLGEVDYTCGKLSYFNGLKEQSSGYSFLTR